MCYCLKEENIKKRDEYVQAMTDANCDNTTQIVYMDKSYIHKNYHRHDDSLYGRQYTTNTTFKTVLTRLKKAFDELDSITVQGCINKANKHLDELREHIMQQEDNNEAAT